MAIIDHNIIQKKYTEIENIWSEDDPWHFCTFNEIKKFIQTTLSQLNLGHEFALLNAGSAGNEYDINCRKHIHIDLTEKHIVNKPNYIIGSVEDLPLKSKEIDFILCVGSVLNYTDAMNTIKEFSRVLNKDGYLILEFENSYSFEYLFTQSFKKNADIVTTFYKNEEEKIWVYSDDFITNILQMNNFKVLKKKNFHILSSLIYKISKKDHLSSKFKVFDIIFSKIPFLKNYSSNVILLCQKV